jgi:hypothetical protein
MPEAPKSSLGVPLRTYGGSDSAATPSKQLSGHRRLMKLSLALTIVCATLFLIVTVPHLHSHFFLISGSSAAAGSAQNSQPDIAGLSDRVVPYKTRIGYFTYAQPLADDRIIAIYQPRYVPGADLRDIVPALRGLRPGDREEYIDNMYPLVLSIDPKIPTGGNVSLMGLRFGASGSACKCIFGGVHASSCEVKSSQLAIIELPSGAHFQIFREANMQPPFIEIKLHTENRFGVSRIFFVEPPAAPPSAAASASACADSQSVFPHDLSNMQCSGLERHDASSSAACAAACCASATCEVWQFCPGRDSKSCGPQSCWIGKSSHCTQVQPQLAFFTRFLCFCAQCRNANSRSQVKGWQSRSKSAIRSAPAPAASVAASENTGLPYKEITNLNTADIQKIIDRAIAQGIT